MSENKAYDAKILSKVFFDIETTPNLDVSEVIKGIELVPPANYKSQAAIDKWIEKTMFNLEDEIVKECSLNPIYGKICSVAMIIDGIEHSFCGVHEDVILKEVSQVLPSHYVLYTFNGKAFDVPFYNTRARINRYMTLPEESKYQNVIHRDLFLHISNFGQFKAPKLGLNLKSVCKHLGISDRDEDGSQVYGLYQDKDWDALQEYNLNDVRDLVELADFLGV